MKVTIIMTAYNAETFINQAIESVLSQTYKNFEFIIVNDGSTDRTLGFIREFERVDNRIIVIDHANIGMGESLNQAIEISKSELIFRMDADDIMMSNRLEEQLSFMNENPKISVLSCLAYYIGKKNKVIGKTFSDLKEVEDCRRYYRDNEVIGLLHPGVVFRKSIIQNIGGYRGKFWPAEDIDLWNRLVEKGHDIVTLQKILMNYRVHGGSTITSKFIESRKKYEWVRETMWNRRKGNSEPAWDDFLNDFNTKSILEKLNWKRKAYAKNHYRAGGFDYANRKYLSFLLHLIGAFVLQPRYAFFKLKKQIIK